MTFVVGFAPDGRGRAVLELAGMLARAGGEDLLVVSVVPSPWLPGPARVDAEYQAELSETANAALDEARSRLSVEAEFLVHHARSTPAGLLEVAEERDAAMIVLGSSSAGAHGHVSLGSVSDRLVHSAHIPVALAPRGYRCRGACPVRRVTAAFGGTDDTLVTAAARSPSGSVRRCGSCRSQCGRARRSRPASASPARTRSSRSGRVTSRPRSATATTS